MVKREKSSPGSGSFGSQADGIKLIDPLKDLAWLSARQQKRLAAAMVVYEVERNGIIFSDDRRVGSDLFILLSGAARLTCINVKGQRRSVAFFPPGIISRTPMPAGFSGNFRCEALCKSRVARVSRDVFIEIALGARVSDFNRIVILFNGGIDNLLTRYPGIAGFGLRARVAIALLELGARFGVHDSSGFVLTITPTQQDLAALVGASRPKVNIVLNEFARRGAIDRKGRRVALVTSQLEAIVQDNYSTKRTQKKGSRVNQDAHDRL